MSLLMKKFQSELAKDKDIRVGMGASFGVAYPTNFLAFDFLNGVVVTVENKEKDLNYTYNSIGIQDGSMICLAGRSGCGKTTFAVQAASNIVRNIDDAFIIHEDIERGISDTRLEQLLNLGDQYETKYMRRNQGISTETFQKRMRMLHDEKIGNYEKYQYDTGCVDSKGEKIYKLRPTVVILDSWAMLRPDNILDDKDIASNMTITSATKQNTAMIKQVFNLLKPANIILFVINHIMPDVSLVPKKSQIAWLKQGERLPGGESIIYLYDNIFRFNDNSKLKEDKDLGINGIFVDIEFVKSRSGAPGRSATFVLDYNVGFDNELSLFILLKQYNKVKGAGAFLYLEGLDTIKFSQKKFKQKLREEPELLQHFAKLTLQVLQEEIINSTASKYKNNQDSLNVGNYILDMMNQGQMVA